MQLVAVSARNGMQCERSDGTQILIRHKGHDVCIQMKSEKDCTEWLELLS